MQDDRLALLPLLVLLAACGKISEEPPPGEPAETPVVAGGACSELDATRPALNDECNTCTCSEGGWVCTELDCTPQSPEDPECTPGDSQHDGCDVCTCTDESTWACTGCEVPCPSGDVKAVDECNSCACAYGVWECGDLDCTLECQPGESSRAPDGCNDCSCTDLGTWACTEAACVDPRCPGHDAVDDCSQPSKYGYSEQTNACCELSGCSADEGFTYFDTAEECHEATVCTEGETKQWDCNTCTCEAGGAWRCTAVGCADVACGGFAGNTCSEDEFCAYEPGGACGAFDASAICQPRPHKCKVESAPVCACNGETYENACMAHGDGWGISSEGPCREP